MRFVPDGIYPDGAQRNRPLHGYHGSLVRHGSLFDFIARNGTRYHFAEPNPDGPRLSNVKDANGNRVTHACRHDTVLCRRLPASRSQADWESRTQPDSLRGF